MWGELTDVFWTPTLTPARHGVNPRAKLSGEPAICVFSPPADDPPEKVHAALFIARCDVIPTVT